MSVLGGALGRNPVIDAVARVLDECRVFVRQVDRGVYTSPSRRLVGGTVGKHVRHLLDHFSALAGRAESPVVDYDHRERGVPVENEPGAALAEIQRLIAAFEPLAEADLAQPIRIRLMCAPDGTECELDSSLGRELAFVTHHAVHHQAMMRAIALEHGARVSTSFGVAPSTMHTTVVH